MARMFMQITGGVASVLYTSNKLKKERDWLGVPETNNKWRAFVIL